MMMPMFGCGTNLGSMGWWGGPLFMFMHLLFWGAIIFGIVWAIRRIFPAVAPAGPRLSEAEEVLKRRYASGEIGSEEFARKKKDLGIRDSDEVFVWEWRESRLTAIELPPSSRGGLSRYGDSTSSSWALSRFRS